MSNPYFQFKQFIVYHDQCAMKVGTDGVLLGAWVDMAQRESVLDIGTGTGLIALMLAQRGAAMVHAVELDHAAAVQANENVRQSAFSDVITIIEADFAQFQSPANRKYNLIVSNPPFFHDSLNAETENRNMARHSDALPWLVLLERSRNLLADNGKIALVIPAESEAYLLSLAFRLQLFETRICRVFTRNNKPAQRVLIELTKQPAVCKREQLFIHLPDGEYSSDYKNITKDFYLNF
jgi:tRNA1Val (adenine37-N6)-methyltransferase